MTTTRRSVLGGAAVGGAVAAAHVARLRHDQVAGHAAAPLPEPPRAGAAVLRDGEVVERERRVGGGLRGEPRPP
ncbi:MAG: hypothetical protein ACKO51_18495, partial [Alphaproteobacteria bacterium]